MHEELPKLLGAYESAEMEIGPGKGSFLLGRARDNPHTLLIAVEIRKKIAALLLNRAASRGLGNLVVINRDAREVIASLASEPPILRRIFLNFPDPWWKRRHYKRALMSPDFLSQMVACLVAGGEIFVQTDVFVRASALLDLLTAHPELSNLAPDGGFLDHNPFIHKTGRELTCEALGLPVFRMYFRKLG